MQPENMVFRVSAIKDFVARIFRCVPKNRQKGSVVIEEYRKSERKSAGILTNSTVIQAENRTVFLKDVS